MADILIWGASGGIGQALVKIFKADGHRVFGVARHDENIPHEADCAFHFDATDPTSFDMVMMSVAQETEAIDVMIYAVGGVLADPIDKQSNDDWQTVMDINLNGAFFASKASSTLLKRDGHMMFIGAYTDKITLPRMGAYVTAKLGLEALVKILRKEKRKRTITIVRPPAVDTNFWETAPFNLPKDALQPDDVANAILTHYQSDGGDELDI